MCMKPIKELTNFLVCPETLDPLYVVETNKLATRYGREFIILNNVPILRDGNPPNSIDINHSSNSVPSEIWQWMISQPGRVLFLGAGATNFRADNVFEVEYNIFRNTDIVVDAHKLPIRSESFQAVVALNVFEHLYNPELAAEEIRRVLVPGGEVLIHTAFLQPLHEEPHHYFNATEFGVKRWFRNFSNINVTVSSNFNPCYTLSWYVNDLLQYVKLILGNEERDKIANLTLEELASLWSQGNCGDSELFKILQLLPHEVQSRFAAGFQLSAVKESSPADKQISLKQRQQKLLINQAQWEKNYLNI
ncbi:Methyltransferase type 11 [Gloeothece citriformis PCC 7424]|uniref:Methyltransferase type 11 n=2 Tax=Gloeothece TaxID=28070 RepID=B7K7D1_GLOC7|nr:Methyltransferase type 11 [Gloeothece citriformis PCC 7424]